MSATKYNVGDKVRVRDDLLIWETYGGLNFMPSMRDMRGGVVTIQYKSPDAYYIDECVCGWTDEMLAPIETTFTKDDLKSGMFVTRRNGSKYLVVRDTLYGDIVIGIRQDGSTSYDNLNRFKGDLTSVSFRELDIVKVEMPLTPAQMRDLLHGRTKILWERKEPKKMTKAEIEKELGYEIEVVE